MRRATAVRVCAVGVQVPTGAGVETRGVAQRKRKPISGGVAGKTQILKKDSATRFVQAAEVRRRNHARGVHVQEAVRAVRAQAMKRHARVWHTWRSRLIGVQAYENSARW